MEEKYKKVIFAALIVVICVLVLDQLAPWPVPEFKFFYITIYPIYPHPCEW